MALVKPFVTKKFIAYPGDSVSAKVSLAVWISDEVTGKRPAIDLTVELKGRRNKPIKNPSGYYCFTDLEAGDYTVVVEPDPIRSDWYFKEEVPVTMPMPDRLKPVQNIPLKPTPAYPFPNQMTLVRGFVTEGVGSNRKPLGAIPVYRLKLGDDGEKLVETKTSHNGEFALHIKNFGVEDGQNGMEVTIEADKGDATRQIRFSILKEGAMVTIDIEFTA